MYVVASNSGRPLPQFSEDDYVDFCVAEAVTLRGMQAQQKADKDAAQKRKVQEWKNEWKQRKQ